MKSNGRNPEKSNAAEPRDSTTGIQAQFREGYAAHQRGELTQAQALYRKVLERQPRHFDALYLSGVIAAQTNSLQQAVELVGSALKISPDNAGAHYTLGNVLLALKRYDEALASFELSIKLNPGEAWAHLNRGNVLKELARWEEALASYDRAIKLNPNLAAGYLNRGNILLQLNQYDHALESFGQAIRLDPDYAEAYYNLGSALSGLRRLSEAIENFDRAIALRPGHAMAYVNRGLALTELGRLDDALESYAEAIRLEPGLAQAYNNRAVTLQRLRRFSESQTSLEHAIKLRPDDADAHFNLGITLVILKRLDEALKCFDHAVSLNPDLDYLWGTRLYTKMRLCDWSDVSRQAAEVTDKIERGQKVMAAFPLLALSSSAALQQKAAEIYAGDTKIDGLPLPFAPKTRRPGRIRIGYFSADFHDHPTAYLMAGLFEQHDKTRFELVAFSFGPDLEDEMRKRVSGAFDAFLDVRLKSDKAVVDLSREMNIDIAVDLKGYTQDARSAIFAHRAAPIQVNYLGYPGTMGVDYMDYLIADEIVIPRESRQYYSEKIVYLPGSYQVNDRKCAIASRTFSRKELGLPPGGFVFCCFNNNYKITPSTFDGWMRILRRVEGSVLWLFEETPTAAGNLRKEAVARGVAAERLVFAKRMPHAEHLARHRVADLVLDTLPYNAHTTASDALWAGLPVLTRSGDAFASRVAASLLHAMGLPRLATNTEEEYEALAVELAVNPLKLAQIKQHLTANRLTAPLFDTALYARQLESAYRHMHERYHADLPPDHLYISSFE